MDKAPKCKETLVNTALKHEGVKYMKKAKHTTRRPITTTEDRWFSSYREGLTAQTGTNETRTERPGRPSPTTHRPSEPRPGSTGARPLRKSAPPSKQSYGIDSGRKVGHDINKGYSHDPKSNYSFL